MWCRARVVGGHATIGRLSNNDFSTFQAIRNFFEKSRWTVTWQWSEVTRPSADCQTTIFRRSKQLEIFWKKSLNGHVTVVGGHATVGRLSNNDFSTFQAIRNFFEKSRWTVTRQWSEVTRPSADCQTTFFGRFKPFGKILEWVAERSRDSGRRSRDRRSTVKQRFLDVSSDLEEFWKKSLNGHATVVEVTRPSADCQTTFFGRFKQSEKFWKKSLNGHVTVVGGQATVGRLSNNVFWTFQAIWENFEKRRWTVTRQWLRSHDRRPNVKQLFWTFQAIRNFFEKKSLNGHVTVDGGQATVGRLSNNVFWTFQAIWENFEKIRWTVTRQWLRSRDPRPTVKQLFLDVSSN